MKKIAKITAVFAALVLALAFVACSEEDDPSVVSEWASYAGDKSITFFDDGTAIVQWDGESDAGSYTSTNGTTTVGSKITFLGGGGTVTVQEDSEGLYFWLSGVRFYYKK